MIGELSSLLNLGREAMFAVVAVFFRVGAIMAVLPAFGEQAIPMRIRICITIAFALIVMPAVTPLFPSAPDMASTIMFIAAEVAVGLTLGIGLRLFVIALQTAGAMAAQATSLAQIFGGSAGVDPQPAISHLLTIAGLALAVMADLHVRVAEMLIASYQAFPPGLMPHASMLASWGTGQVAQAFAMAFTLSAPFVVAALIYNAALGVMNRAMPQLMVTFVGAPALTFGGLALLFLAVPTLLEIWLVALNGYLADPTGAAS